MRRKLFAEYLLEKGMITELDLVEALVEQIKCLPSICEIIFEKKIMPVKQILDVLIFQTQNRCEFLTAARKLNYVTVDVEKRVMSEFEKIRRPVVEILINKRGLEISEITKSLDNYLVEATEVPQVPASPQTADIAPAILLEIGEQYSQETKERLLQLLDGAMATQDDVSLEEIALRELSEIIHRIGGVAIFSQQEALIKTVGHLESILSELKNTAFKNRDDRKDFVENIRSSIESTWHTRNEILKSREGGVK